MFVKFPKFVQIGVLIGMLLIYGCASRDAARSEGNEVEYTGTLKSLGEVLVEEKADHILESDDGNVYYVYSQFIDLDKEKYKNARVQIHGEIVKITESAKEIIAIESVVPLTEEFIERDVKGDIVKKYQNLEMGFKLDELKAFQVKEYQNQVVFEKDDVSLTVTRFDNTTSLTLEEWLTLSNVQEYTPIFLGQDKLKAYTYEKSLKSRVYFISRTNQYIYEVDLVFTDNASMNELKSILNSFRFVPLSEDGKASAPSADGAHSAIEIDTVKAYFAEHLNELVDEKGDYKIVKFEFLNEVADTAASSGRNYTYIVYEVSNTAVRVLVSYHFKEGKVSDAFVEAVFKQGSVTDWELVSGSDKAKGLPTLVVSESDDALIAVEEGYRLFESAPFDFSIQYPSNWYVEGQSGKYLFNDAPLDGEYLISVEIQKKKLEDIVSAIPFKFEKVDLAPGRKMLAAHPDDPQKYGVYILMSGSDEDETYVFWSVPSKEDILIKMLKSLIES